MNPDLGVVLSLKLPTAEKNCHCNEVTVVEVTVTSVKHTKSSAVILLSCVDSEQQQHQTQQHFAANLLQWLLVVP